MNECNFCKSKFKSQYILKQHQKRAKYCIEIKNKIQKKFLCLDCSNEFFENDFNNHIEICVEKRINNIVIEKEYEYENKIEELTEFYENKIKELKELIDTYESKLSKNHEELIDIIKSSKTTVINKTNTQNTQRINTVINNLIPITDEHFQEQSQFLTIDHVKEGLIGYVKYALEHQFKDRIICVDYARRKIRYKNSNGDIVDDPEMVTLSEKFFKSIESQNSNIINEYVREIGQELFIFNSNSSNEMDDSETEIYNRKSDEMLEKLNQAFIQRTEVKDASKGKKPNLYIDFVKDVCAKTIK